MTELSKLSPSQITLNRFGKDSHNTKGEPEPDGKLSRDEVYPTLPQSEWKKIAVAGDKDPSSISIADASVYLSQNPDFKILEYPVLLLHSIMDDENNWFVLEAFFKSHACCELNENAITDGKLKGYKKGEGIFRIHFKQEEESILERAKEVKKAVEIIKRNTGSNRVNIIGFSTGGVAGLCYFVGLWDPGTNNAVKNYAYDKDINDIVLFEPPLQGTPLAKTAKSIFWKKTFSFNFGPRYGNRTWIIHTNPPSPVIEELYPNSQFIKIFNKKLSELPPDKRGKINIFAGTKGNLFSILIEGEDDGMVPFPKFPGENVQITSVPLSHGGCREDSGIVLPKVVELLTDFK